MTAFPNKAIPPARDRLQSRILVWMVISTLAYTAYLSPRYFAEQAQLPPSYLAKIAVISIVFACAAWRLRAATPAASILGGTICFFISAFSSIPGNTSPLHSALTQLILLFLLTFSATRFGRAKKFAAGLAEDRNGRNSAQITANLSIAAIAGSPWIGWRFTSWFEPLGNFGYSGHEGHVLFIILCSVATLAALAEATADTVSSEIGQAFGGTPFLLTTLRRVPPGTDGAITLVGTLAGICAAGLIAITGVPAMGMSLAECAIAFAAGVAGLFFDSLLGATIERRGWLGNDLVNFSSTAFAALFSLVAVRLVYVVLR